jgi:hypothetical protein
MAQGEGDHPLLDQGAGGVGHAWWPPLSWSQDLGAMPVKLALPAVVGGGMDAHRSAGGPHIAELGRHREDP